MEHLLHGCVIITLEETQTSWGDDVLELTVKFHRGEGALLQRILLADFERLQVNFPFLFVQHEHVTVVAGALRGKCTEVGDDGLSAVDIVTLDICTEGIGKSLIWNIF